jgi:hypothetical protein
MSLKITYFPEAILSNGKELLAWFPDDISVLGGSVARIILRCERSSNVFRHAAL